MRALKILSLLVVTAAFAVPAGTALAAPAEGPVRGAGAAGAVKDSYIVVLKDRAASAGKVRGTAEALVRRYGGTVRQSFASTVRGFSVGMTEAQAKRLAGYPDVAYVEQDRAVSLTGTQTNPPSWGLDRIDQASLPLVHRYGSHTNRAPRQAHLDRTGVR